MIDSKRIALRASLLTLFVAVTIISSIFIISQTQYGLLAKKTSGNKSSSGQASTNSSSSSSTPSSPSRTPIGSSSSSIPTHCDQPGYASCYSVGYSDGQNAPGTNCPNGHSRAYCEGYTAGSGVSSLDTGRKNRNNQNSGVNLNQNGLTNSNTNLTSSPFSHANTKSAISNNADVSSNVANTPSSSLHKSKSDNPTSLKQNSKVNLSQAGQSDSNISLTNSSGSHTSSKSGISNNADVSSNVANTPSSSLHKSKSDNPTSLKQNSKVNLSQAGLSNSNINLTNSPNSNVDSKSSISNNADVKSTVNNGPSSTHSGTSSSPTVTQNSQTTVNQGAQNNANINVNNSPGTRITNEQTIKQSVRINNEVNKIIKNNEVNNIIKQNTISTPLQPLTDIVTIKLAKSSMSSGALFPLADVEPYSVIGGHITANLPSSSQQNIVVAEISDNGQILHAVILDLKQITGSNLDQNSLYESNLGSDISGTNPFTGNSDEVKSITNLFLWNNNQQAIGFDNANGVTMNLIYK